MDLIYYMQKAIEQAEKAYQEDEVPIGCVIVFDNKIIGQGYNQRNSGKNVLYHAEIIAIDMACKYINDWRLEEATIFVTVEPCPMCAGAILQARIKNLVYGVPNKKFGCAGSIYNLLQEPSFNHQVDVTCGVLNEECKALMQNFFKRYRTT